VWYLNCRETADAEEFEELVQQMLQADSGFSWQDFADFLATIVNRRLATARKLQQQQQQQCVDGQLQDKEQQQVAQHDGDDEQQQLLQQQCVERHQQDADQTGAAQYERDVQQQQQQQQQDEACHPTAADAGAGATTLGSQTSGAAAAAGCSDCDSAQMAAGNCTLGLQLQMLHCALDLQRAATLLQQVQQASAAAAAHNAAWCAKHNSSSSGSSSRGLSALAGQQQQQQQQHVRQASERSEGSCNATAVQAGVCALPAWVVNAGGLARLALQVVQQLKQWCDSVQRYG
jgi:hypothetical protein